MNAGILPLFLSLFTLNDKDVSLTALKMILYVFSMCEQSKDGSLWNALGVSRANSHIVMDYIASHCSITMVDEEVVRSILVQIMGESQLEDNDNLTIQMAPLIPLFLQLLPLIREDLIFKYYSIFIDVFTNIQSTLNLSHLLHLPYWYDYIFSFVCRIQEEKKDSVDAVWSRLQNLLVSVVMSSAEKNLYAGSGNIAEIRKDTESVHLLTVVFSAIKHYMNKSSVQESPKSYDKGFIADFFILIVNRIVATLGMPGDKSFFLVTIDPVVQYLYDVLVSMMEIPIDEDEVEVERDHYQWQLISPFHTLVTTIVETISRVNVEARKQIGLDVLKQKCYTLDLSLLLALLNRYNLIINDHCASGEEEAVSPNPSDLLGGLPGLAPTPAIPATQTMPTQEKSALDDLLGGIATQTQPATSSSALDDLLGVPQTQPAAPSMDDLLGLPQSQPSDAISTATSTSPIYVTATMEEKYRPLYNEAILIAKQLKLFVSNSELPCENIVYLSHLNDAVRTLTSEVRLFQEIIRIVFPYQCR